MFKARHKTTLNFYICKISLWPYNVGTDFTFLNSLFNAAKLTKNADPNKYSYSGFGVRFDVLGFFSLTNGSGLCKTIIIFGVDNSSSVHADN